MNQAGGGGLHVGLPVHCRSELQLTLPSPCVNYGQLDNPEGLSVGESQRTTPELVDGHGCTGGLAA